MQTPAQKKLKILAGAGSVALLVAACGSEVAAVVSLVAAFGRRFRSLELVCDVGDDLHLGHRLADGLAIGCR